MLTRIGDWIETFTGIKFYPLDPMLDEINIEDVAHALSMQCRFGGHAKQFFSVAQHCLNVANELRAVGASREVQLQGLLHDASEAYLVDLPRPIKYQMPEYGAAEKRLQFAIYRKFRVQHPDDNMVKFVDGAMLQYEAQFLMPCKSWSPGAASLKTTPHLGVRSPRDVAAQFLQAFETLKAGGDE